MLGRFEMCTVLMVTPNLECVGGGGGMGGPFF